MPKLNWKSLFLLVPVTIVGAVILVGGIFSTIRLPVFNWSGLAPFAVLIGITLISSRFTVPFTNVDGSSQSNKSVADAFIFLAVMMYTMPPANTLGPAIVLAAIVGFISSLSDKGRWNTIFAVGMSVISTFVASQVYRAMLLVIAGESCCLRRARLCPRHPALPPLRLWAGAICTQHFRNTHLQFVLLRQTRHRLTREFDLDTHYPGCERNLGGILLFSHPRQRRSIPIRRRADHHAWFIFSIVSTRSESAKSRARKPKSSSTSKRSPICT